VTTVASGFPWTATATTTTNIQIHGLRITIGLEHIPGDNPGQCGLNGADLLLTGTVTSGRWTHNAPDPSLDFVDAEGLVSHSGLGVNQAVTARGFITDTQGTLSVTG
jgi:hypothetical protein